MGRASCYVYVILPSEGGIKLLGDLQLGSGISSTLPNEEEGACILGWRVREHSGSSGCMFILQYFMAIIGPALVSDDSHPLSQNKLLQWSVIMLPLHTEKISVGLEYRVCSSVGWQTCGTCKYHLYFMHSPRLEYVTTTYRRSILDIAFDTQYTWWITFHEFIASWVSPRSGTGPHSNRKG